MRKIRKLAVLSLFGCFLFLGSTVFPFLLEYRGGEFWFASDDVSYWSFKSSTQHEALGTPTGPAVDLWFYDYWSTISTYGVGYLPVFISMFLAQILTLIAGVGSALIKRSFLAIAPTILCSIVIALMTYINTSFKQEVWSHNTQPGYWLAFPSLFMFLLVTILSYLWANGKKEENTTT